MYRALRSFRTARVIQQARLAQQTIPSSLRWRPPARYNFSKFERYKETRTDHPNALTKDLLRNFFHIRDDGEAVHVEGDYYNWWNNRAEAIDVAALLKQNWNRAKVRSEMRSALGTLYRSKRWALGYPKGSRKASERVQLEIKPPFLAHYFLPPGTKRDDDRNPSFAFGPIMFTSAELLVPREDYNQYHSAAFDSTPMGPEALPAPPPGFETRLVHLGQVCDMPEKTPYAAVGKLNEIGTVEGMFAIPVMNNEELACQDENDDDSNRHNEEDGCHKIYGELCEAMPRGIYYLGKDLEDCADREWILCQEVDKVIVVSPIER